MATNIKMMSKNVSPRSNEEIMNAADGFFDKFVKTNISGVAARVIKQAIPLEGETVTEDEGKEIARTVSDASDMIIDEAIEQELINLSPSETAAAESFLDSIARVASKYVQIETNSRITRIRQAIESGRMPNIDENPEKFRAFLRASFDTQAFSSEGLTNQYLDEINFHKSFEEETLISTIKEKVTEDIEETEKNNQLFSDIIEKTEEVKEEYGDKDPRDGRPAPTEEQDENMGGDDMGAGGDMGGGSEGGMDDMGEEGGNEEGESPDDIPTGGDEGEEGYSHSAIHSNRTNMATEEDDENVDYEDEEFNEDEYKGPKYTESELNEDDEDYNAEDSVEALEIKALLEANDDIDLTTAFGREEEEVMRAIAEDTNIKLEPRDDDTEDPDEVTINPYRSMGSLSTVDDDAATSGECRRLSIEQLTNKLLDYSLMQYKMIPNYSAESMSNMLVKLNGKKLGEFTKSVEKMKEFLRSEIYRKKDPMLKEKIESFESNWYEAKRIADVKHNKLSELGLSSTEVWDKNSIITLSIAKNLLNSYSKTVHKSGRKLANVYETLGFEDNSREAKMEGLVDTIFKLGRSARHMYYSTDIVKAREEFIEQEKRANKDMNNLNLDEKDAEKVSTLQELLMVNKHKKQFIFDDLYNSYNTCFMTIKDKIELADSMNVDEFSQRVIKQVENKRGFLSKEDIDIVNDHIKGIDIALKYSKTPYSKFIMRLSHENRKSGESFDRSTYAFIATKSKVLTTIYHSKETFFPQLRDTNEKELDESISEMTIEQLSGF